MTILQETCTIDAQSKEEEKDRKRKVVVKRKIKKILKPSVEQADDSRKSSGGHTETSTPSLIEQVKLKPTQTQKLSISETKLEIVNLKSHIFEEKPLDEIKEMQSNIILGEPIVKKTMVTIKITFY